MSIPPWFDDRPLEDIREDLLGFAAPARRLAGRLDRFWHPSRGHALAVSLEGPWGSGKTSFTNMVIQTLRQSCAKGPPVVVRFNVWQSGSMDLTEWSALAYRIGEAIYTEIHRRCRENIASGEPVLSVLPPGLVGQRLGPLERVGAAVDIDCSGLEDPRLHWIEVATRIADAMPAEHWHPALALFCDAPTKIPGRGIPWSNASQGLAHLLAGGAEAAITGRAGGMGRGAARAMAALTPHKLVSGPTWGVDSLEFVRDLAVLLQILLMDAERWRAIVVVDDVTRLKESDLPQVLDTLGYLRELRDVLVLVNLDSRVIDLLREVSPPHRTQARDDPPQHEDFLTKLVNVRHPIPQVPQGKLGRLAHEWWSTLGLPPAWEAGSRSNPTRRLVAHGVTTPRQFKRALQWMWLRLDGDTSAERDLWRALRLREIPAEGLEAVLAFLVDLHLYGEQRIDGDALVRSVEKRAEVLLEFDTQPWNGCDWEDRHFRVGAQKAKPATKALIRTLRLCALASYAGIDRRQKRDAEVWAHWAAHLQRDDPGRLQAFAAMDTREDLLELYDHIIALVSDRDLTDLLGLSWLSAVSRQCGIVEERITLSLEVLMRWWWDGDVVFRATLQPPKGTYGRKAQVTTAAAWILLCAFHPTIVRHMSADIERCEALKALELVEMVSDLREVFQP